MRCIDFFQQIRMTTHRTLTKNDHVTRQNIRAFHRDTDRNLLISTPQIIPRTDANTFATVNIHRVIHRLTPAFGQMVFDDGRSH